VNSGISNSVRPTKRCLDDLGLSFPLLTSALYQIAHPLVRQAQALPEKCAANGAVRVVSLTDRVWWKVKTGTHRGIATNEVAEEHKEAPWWLGAAGRRRDGDHDDFYKQIENECARTGKGTGSPSSAHLLPQPIDWERLHAETAARTVIALQAAVREAIAGSIRTGDPHSTLLANGWGLTALVRANKEDAYLALIASGGWDPAVYSLILDAVPGVPSGDWLPEPRDVVGIVPEADQIIWSTVLSPQAQTDILGDRVD
jgi:hypothetical protein